MKPTDDSISTQHFRFLTRTPRPELLPELVQKLETKLDVPTISGVLATANSIFKRQVAVLG